MATKKQATRQISSWDELDSAGYGLGYQAMRSQEPEPQEAPIESRSTMRAVGDLATQVGTGLVGGVRMMSDMFGADNRVSQGFRSAEEALGGLLSAQAVGDQQKIAEILKEAEGKGWADQVAAGLKAASVAPGALMAQALGTSIPTIATAMIPGAGPAAIATRLGAAGVMGAAQGAGNIKGVIYEDVKKELAKTNPGMAPEEIEARAVEAQSFAGPNAGQIALGGALGVAAGTTGMEKVVSGLRHGVTKTPAGIMGRMVGGGVVEAVPEFGQGGQEKYASNTALNNEGFQIDPMSGVIAQGTMEAAAGFGAGALTGIPKPKQMDPATQAADLLNTNLVPETGPLGRAANAGTKARANTLAQTGIDPMQQAPQEPPLDDPIRDQIAVIPDEADRLAAEPVVEPQTPPASDKPATLPTNLSGAKPNYSFGDKKFSLNFDSDIDRAAYITAQGKPSKKDADYLKFAMDATGMTEAEVRAHGQKVKDSIKAQAKGAEPGKLAVPGLYAPKAAPAAKPTTPDVTLTNEGKTDAPAKMSAWNTPKAAYMEATGERADVHRGSVERALKAGKPIPADVLADYPDLAPITPETGKDTRAAPAQAPAVTAESGAPVTRSKSGYAEVKLEGKKHFVTPFDDQFVIRTPIGNTVNDDQRQPLKFATEADAIQYATQNAKRVKPAPVKQPAQTDEMVEAGRPQPPQAAPDQDQNSPQSRWTRATTNERIAIARAGGIALKPAENVTKKAWDKHDPVVQEKLAKGFGSDPALRPETIESIASGAAKREERDAKNKAEFEAGADERRTKRDAIGEPEWGDFEGVQVLRIKDSPFVAVPTSGKRLSARFDIIDTNKRDAIVAQLTGKEVRPWLIAKAGADSEPQANDAAPIKDKDEKPKDKPKRPQGGATLRKSAYDKNPLLTLLATKGLFHDKDKKGSLKSEFSPDKQIMVSGYGPVFKKSGLKLDALLDFAIEDGYLSQGASEQELYSLIQRAVSGEKISPSFSEQGMSDMEAEFSAELQRRYEERPSDMMEQDWYGQDEAGYADEWIDKVARLSDADEQRLSDAIDEVWDAPAGTASTRDAMEALGFTEQEIQDEGRRSISSADEVAARKAGRGDGQGQTQAQTEQDARQGTGQTEGLTAPTRADVLAQQDRQENAEALDQRAQVGREASGFTLQSQTQDNRTDNTGDMFGGPSVDDFQQSANQNAKPGTANTGPDLFDATQTEPADKAKPAPAKESEQAKPAKIEDSGEVLEGARKLYAKSYAAKLDEGTGMETASVPLSKSWPEPDYQRLIEEGADPWAVALARAVRDEIPTKPMKGWKLKGWVAKVEGLREMAQRAMDGSLTKEKFTGEAAKFKLDDWLNKVDLYEAVGHAESLKGMKFAEHEYSFFGGQKFDPPKKLWTVNAPSASASATWSNGNWGNDLVVADTKAEAIEKFKAWVAEQAAKAEDGEGKPVGKRTEFNVYSYRNNPKVFIVGKRISATKSIDLMEFESAKDARAFIAANQDKLETMLAEAKAEQSERREENAPRVGDDHRSGGDVTTEQFREAFGFRGEQFGASMPQSERQSNMNQAYDALMDLAGVIGVPPKALSLNGELGLAFGARGHGGKNPAMAHYEPDTTGAVTPNRVVINLTRKNGAGSLAHEWFHAVDNYFARMRGEKGGMLTESYPAKRDGVRPEMVDAFKRVMNSIQASGLRERSKNMDKKRTKDYWSTGLEMAARSFESYVIAKLQDKSGANDYLANILPESAWLRENEYPYPTMGELPLIRAAFDNFFATVQTKETDKGVAMFSRGTATQQAYEARIDALFAGGKANLSGVNLLEKSDVLDLLGLGNMPVQLDEAKAVLNQTNHPEMTADVWKKIPDWLDNPALVAKSSTVQGRYVITPSETVQGYPVRIIVEPKGGSVQVHALVNAYAPMSANGAIMEAKRIAGQIGRGDVVYVDTKKVSELLDRSGLQLPRLPSLNTDRKKILTEKNLSGYRKSQDPAMSRGFGTGMTQADAQDVVAGITDRWANAPKVVVVQSMQDADVPDAVRMADAKQKSQGASGEPEGFWYGGKVYIVVGTLKSPGDVRRVLFHEALGHYGLQGTYGKALTPILKQIVGLRRPDIILKARDYGLVQKGADGKPLVDVKTATDEEVWSAMSEADRLYAAEEVLAEMAQTRPDLGFVKRAVAVIRAFLRKNVPGFAKLQMTDEDIITNFLIPARRFVEGGSGRAGGGVSFSRSAMKSVDANIKRGLEALAKALDERTTVHRAMFRNGLGWVDFVWGAQGVVKPSGNTKGAMGLTHIIEARQRKDGLSDREVLTLLEGIVDAIASGTEISRRELESATRVGVENGDTVVWLTKQKGSNAWIVTAYEKNPDGANAGRATFAPTPPESSLTRDQRVAGFGDIVRSSGSDVNFSRTMGATELAGQVRDKLFDVSGATGNTLAHYRGMALQALGRRQLVDIYGDMLPQLKQYDELVQRMDAEKNDSAAEADAIANEWGKLDERAMIGVGPIKLPTGTPKYPGMERKLAELMHDATLAQMDPDKPLQDGDNPGQHAALKAKFDALSPKAQSVYRRARDMYEGHYAKVREAIQERIMRSELGASEKKAMIAKMDEDFFQKTKGVYFPLARFGKYVMVVKDAEGKTVNVSRAETLNEAETTRKVLLREFDKAKGFAVTKVMKEADFNQSLDMVGKGFVTDLFAVLDKQGVDGALRDSVSQLYLSSLPDLSWAKHGIHRKGTPGFSQDARRAFAQNVFHGARYLAKLRYSDQLQNELTAMEDHIKVYESVDEYDGVKAQQVADEMVKRHDNLMSPDSHPLSTALTSVGFVWFLGVSPAAAMVNLTQTALVAYPVMGAKWGYDKAASALLLASKQTVQSKNDISKILTGDELDAYNRAVADGTIDVTMAHDLAGISQGEDAKVTWALRPVMKVASFMFHHAERFNRQATFIASYRLAKESGAGLEAAFEQAKKATYDGHFDYRSSNRPRIMQGNVAKVVLLFKQYGQNMVYTMSRQAYLATQSLNPKERAEARKQLGGMLALHAAAAGALGLPLVGALLSAASFIGSDDDEPWDAEIALKNMMADAMGPKAAEVMAHGLSRLTPWDLSGRVALNKLILPDVQEGLEGRDLWREILSQAVGPVFGIGEGFFKGMKEMGEGRYQRGFESMLPVALRNPVKAMRYQEEGAIDKTGIPIKDEVSMAGVLGQASGFAPSEVRAATEVKSAIYQLDNARSDRRKSLMSQFAQAKMAGDTEGMQEVREAIAKFNDKNPRIKITPLQLLQSVNRRQKRIDEAEKGVYLPKNRRDAIEAVRFGG